MALDGCGVVCKYILLVFNIIFAVVGLAFLGLGLWLRFSENTRAIFSVAELNSSAFVIGVTVLIALGSVMLIVVVFGDYGACNEKKSALQVFSVLLFLLAIAEFVVGALAYSNRGKVGEKLGEFYMSLYSLYVNSQDPAIGVTLTFIHNSLHCCGMTGVHLIEMVKQTCPKPDGIMEHIVMPNCPVTIVTVFDSRAPLVMGIFIGTGALLITALVCASLLLKQIKREHQEVTTYYSTVY
ncbi:CD9 antigen-like isoform 2-T2 [Fundulus diaphanus]